MNNKYKIVRVIFFLVIMLFGESVFCQSMTFTGIVDTFLKDINPYYKKIYAKPDGKACLYVYNNEPRVLHDSYSNPNTSFNIKEVNMDSLRRMASTKKTIELLQVDFVGINTDSIIFIVTCYPTEIKISHTSLLLGGLNDDSYTKYYYVYDVELKDWRLVKEKFYSNTMPR